MPGETGETPIPVEGLGAPARRALDGTGHTTPEQLAGRGEDAVADLHGIGSSPLETLREALDAHDTSFAGEP